MIASGEGRSQEAAAAASGGSAIRYKTGDVIVTADPLVHLLACAYGDERCENCYKIKQFQYCCRQCQQEDWKSFHKHGECRLLHMASNHPGYELKPRTEPHYASLFLRTHLLLKAKPWLMNQKFRMHDGTERSLADVPDDAERCGHHSGMILAICDFLKTEDRKNYSAADVQALVSLFHKIRNSFLIISRYQIGLYVSIIGLKHSCRPNASYVFKDFAGKKLEVRALKDIAEGEDVTIDLIDIMKPKADRQEELANSRGIVCHCDRCHEGDQDGELTEMAANRKYRKFMRTPDRVLPSLRSAFEGFLSLIDIKEKYQGRFHPEFIDSMNVAVVTASVMRNKSVKEKQNYDLLIERLKEALPLSYGLDPEYLNMRFQRMTDQSDWSNLLPYSSGSTSATSVIKPLFYYLNYFTGFTLCSVALCAFVVACGTFCALLTSE